MRALLIGTIVGWLVMSPVPGSARGAQGQGVEIDRTLQRIYGTAIMMSDVREARILKLVPEASAGDEAVQRALENRLLLLHEMTRAQPADAGRDAIAARRQVWTASWPAGTDLPALMTKCGTTDQAIDGWFRAELQIAAFVTQRVGQPGDPGRDTKYNEWIAELRKRANLR